MSFGTWAGKVLGLLLCAGIDLALVWGMIRFGMDPYWAALTVILVTLNQISLRQK